jgi:hypothetical protein
VHSKKIIFNNNNNSNNKKWDVSFVLSIFLDRFLDSKALLLLKLLPSLNMIYSWACFVLVSWWSYQYLVIFFLIYRLWCLFFYLFIYLLAFFFAPPPYIITTHLKKISIAFTRVFLHIFSSFFFLSSILLIFFWYIFALHLFFFNLLLLALISLVRTHARTHSRTHSRRLTLFIIIHYSS